MCPSWGLLEGWGTGGPCEVQGSPVPQGQWCVGQDVEELGVCVSPMACTRSVACQQCCRRGQLLSRHFLSWSRVMKSYHGCAQASPGDTAVRQQLAEREQALLLAQETIQVSPPSVTPAKHCPCGSTEGQIPFASPAILRWWCMQQPKEVFARCCQPPGLLLSLYPALVAPLGVGQPGGGFAVVQPARVCLRCSSGCSTAVLGSWVPCWA